MMFLALAVREVWPMVARETLTLRELRAPQRATGFGAAPARGIR